MGRSGYTEDGDFDNWSHIRWRGQVASAMKGKRGQEFLRELIGALDALPEKRLIAHDLSTGGNVCAIGSVGIQRGVDMSKLDPEDPWAIAEAFGIAQQMVREIEYMNDEGAYDETPEQRWRRMHRWASAHLTKAPAMPHPRQHGDAATRF
ncbi:hypothetical protein GCM10008023_05570 [Sphingomonas glacialis]|uniref:Uncharacterized protein n=1 Tax=Sphingomonas glacialis TaxID=658225 RepID=A0ABQ3L939_9SPHN|nr:hypothetical protein [Sphingomonas glacialis]GHH09211.1 hypothetical protein GCM10008023_05570 [Sphingomonas glacialis]